MIYLVTTYVIGFVMFMCNKYLKNVPGKTLTFLLSPVTVPIVSVVGFVYCLKNKC